MTFSMGDIRDFRPENQQIDLSQNLSSARLTSIDIPKLYSSAINSLNAAEDPVSISDDCGLYVCNFIYYNSLMLTEKRRSRNTNDHSMFVHIPPLSQIDETGQVNILYCILRELTVMFNDKTAIITNK
jgi:pyrrolidone-carboxylate peptidase